MKDEQARALLRQILAGCERMLLGAQEAVDVGERLIQIVRTPGLEPNPTQLTEYEQQCARARRNFEPMQQMIEKLKQDLGVGSRRH